MSGAENWLPVAEVGGRYEVSSLGRVRNAATGHVLAPKRKANGYLFVCLCVDGAVFYRHIHRLVCQAFLGDPPSPDCHADHINGERAFNPLSNLRWATPQENRARRRSARGEGRPESKLTEDSVRAIRADPSSLSTLAARFGVGPQCISKVKNRRSWAHVD